MSCTPSRDRIRCETGEKAMEGNGGLHMDISKPGGYTLVWHDEFDGSVLVRQVAASGEYAGKRGYRFGGRVEPRGYAC